LRCAERRRHAVGIIIGAAFGTIIAALVSEVLMPPIGLLLGNVDFSNLFIVLKEGKTIVPTRRSAAAKAAGAVTLNYGMFVNTVVNFLIVAFAIFPDPGHELPEEEGRGPAAAPATKECPHCLSTIPIKATRCGHCTSELKAA